MKKRTVFSAIFALLAIFSLSSEEAWKRFEEGRARFEARQFDLALVAFKGAVEIRLERYGRARERLESVLSSAEAKKSGASWIGSPSATFAKATWNPREKRRPGPSPKSFASSNATGSATSTKTS
jgi:hypothetical protein